MKYLCLTLLFAISVYAEAQSPAEKAKELIIEIKEANKSDLSRSEVLCEEALIYAIESGDIELESEVRGLLSYAAKLNGNQKRALEMSQWELDRCRESGEPGCLGNKLNHLALDMKRYGDFETAHEYLNQALPDCIAAKDTNCISTNYDHRGLMYLYEGRYEEAFEQLFICLELREASKDSVGLSFVYERLAWGCVETGRQEEGLEYLFKCLEIRKQNFDGWSVAQATANIAETYASMDQLDSAANWFNRSLEIARSVDYRDVAQYALFKLSEIYERQGNFRASSELFKKALLLQDSLNSASVLEATAELKTRYETELKEQKIAVQELEIDRQKARSRFILIASIALLAVFTLGGSLVWQQNRNRTEKQIQKAELSHQADLLRTSIQAQEKERSRIAQDLHDGIGATLSSLKMSMSGYSEHNKNPEFGRITAVLHETADEVRALSHQMMPRALTTSGLIASLEDLLSNSLRNSSIKIGFDHKIKEDKLSQDQKISLYRIAQEVINNMLKYAQASEFDLQLYEVRNMLHMHLEDNGKGFDQNKKQNGHGMFNIVSRAQAVGGQVDIDSAPGNGTRITVKVPMV